MNATGRKRRPTCLFLGLGFLEASLRWGFMSTCFIEEKQGMSVERAENKCPIRAGSALPGPVQGSWSCSLNHTQDCPCVGQGALYSLCLYQSVIEHLGDAGSTASREQFCGQSPRCGPSSWGMQYQLLKEIRTSTRGSEHLALGEGSYPLQKGCCEQVCGQFPHPCPHLILRTPYEHSIVFSQWDSGAF